MESKPLPIIFTNANVELTTLSDYNALIEHASKIDYIKEAEKSTLAEWRVAPEKWGK